MYNKLMLILAQNYHDLLNNDPTRVNNTIPIYCIYVELNYEQIDKQRRAVVMCLLIVVRYSWLLIVP